MCAFGARSYRLSTPLFADYPYPLNTKGNPIDTPEWRNADDITTHAPKKHEKNAPDSALLKAIRGYEENGMGPVDAALAAGTDVNAVDKLGFTALHLAIKNKNGAIAEKLLGTDGVDLEAKTRKGFTALHMAAWKGDLGLVQKLITKGCDLSAKDSSGRNVWGIAHDWHHEEVRAHSLSLGQRPCARASSRQSCHRHNHHQRLTPVFASVWSDPRAAEAQQLPLRRGRRACVPSRAKMASRAPR